MEAFRFHFKVGDYQSRNYQVKLFLKPVLQNMKILLSYPAYIQKEDETIENLGDLTIPEGSLLKWEFQTRDVDKLHVRFSDTAFHLKANARNRFELQKYFLKSDVYKINTSNKYMVNSDTAQYYINVIPDAFPRIQVDLETDSFNQKYVYFNGRISDDYGLSLLTFNYSFNTTEDSLRQDKTFKIPVSIASQALEQLFYYSIDLKELGLRPGDEVEYYFEVWDNDAINGHKSTSSQRFYYAAASKEELKEEAENLSEDIKESMQDAVEKAKQLQEDMKEAQKKLLDDKQLDWEDKQFIEKILEEQKALEKQVEELKEKYIENVNKQDEYKNLSEETLEKYEELFKKFEELIPQELKELYEELERLMQKNLKNDIQKELDKFKQSEKDVEKELDRMLELYKRLEFEQKMDESIEDLEKLAEEQEKLSEENPKSEEEKQQHQEKQEELNKEFEDLQEDLDELEKMNEELENPNQMEDTREEEEEIREDQQQSLEQMKQGKMSKSSKSQKNASQKMKKLAEKLNAMKMNMEMKSLEINYEKLRRLLENLMYVSFEQENLIDVFSSLNSSNPRYVEYANQQKKLKDDMRMIEDSLFALSKELPMIASYVNKEVNDINFNLRTVLDLISDRKVAQARGKQQYVMTSMNNVALMLSELLKQMQDEMQSGKGKMKGNKKGKKKGNSFESLRQLQEQLNKQIQDMKNGKPGSKMSKQLAQMAAKQEMLRNALRKLEEEKNKDGSNPFGNLSEIQKLMEETEKDIINKNITNETLKRQKEIEVRLLEAEKAEKEQGKEEKRESKTARDIFNQKPPSLDDYIREKEKEIEILRKSPLELKPYYRIKVKEYYRLLNQ
jgi:hypothetical protein